MIPFPTRLAARRGLSIGVAAAAVALFAVVGTPSASAAPASTTTDSTLVTASPNPTDVGTSFTVTALQCDYVKDVQATGTMVFTDATTATALGAVTMVPSEYANCGEAQITDTEALGAGHYTLKAHYMPGGSTPVPASRAGTAKETVKSPTFTNITWVTGATIPHPHFEGATVGAGKKVYAISGDTADCSDGDAGTVTTVVDAYNTTTNTFHTEAPIPHGRTGDPSAIDVGGTIYVVGGQSSCGGPTVTPVDTYSPSSNTWTTLPAASDLPSSLNGQYHCAAAMGSDIYYFEQEGVGVLDTAASPPSWTVLSASPLLDPSYFCSAVTIGDDIVIDGPGDGSADSSSQRLLIFAPSTDTMTLSTATTFPAAEGAFASVMGQGVVAGGDFAGTGVDLVLPGLQVVRAAGNLPQSRDDCGNAAVIGGKIYIVSGGEEGVTTMPPVLIGTPN